RAPSDRRATRPVGEHRPGEIRGTPDELGKHGRQRFDRLLRCLARGNTFALARLRGDERSARLLPVFGQFVVNPARELRGEIGIGCAMALEALRPRLLERGAAIARVPRIVDVLRNLEWRVVPAERGAGAGYLLGPQCGTVRLRRTRLGGRALG